MTNLPQPRPEPREVWSRFSADPRSQSAVRASDADRDVAASVVNDAFADGRLDIGEHSERLDAVMRARTLGEMVPLLSDVTVAARPQVVASVRSQQVRGVAVRSWLGLAVLFNVIWLLTSLAAGHLGYYWPMWPMLGTAIPLLLAWVSGGSPDAPGADRGAEAEGRRAARLQRRAARRRRRGLPRG